MPPYCLHMLFAQEAASRWEHPDIISNMGSYLLGSTAPDIRIITGAEREDTHFYDLRGDSSQSGMANMLLTYPKLAKLPQLNATTRAFLAGYFSHLVVDELWIVDIFRPLFGRTSPLGDDPLAIIMDRALQYDLDRRERLRFGDMARIREHLAATDMDIQVEFLEANHLEQWRDNVTGATLREPTFEGFMRFAERFLLAQQKVAPHQWELFATSPEVFWQRSMNYVALEHLEAFRENSIARSVEQSREYLS